MANEQSCSRFFLDRPRRGKLLVVSGPSGVGKTSVVEALSASAEFHFSVSMTTRAPRPTEVEGVDYFFVTRPQFESAVQRGELLEWAEYGGHLYGTPRGPVVERVDSGDDVLLDIENDGAAQVKTAYPDAVLVFLVPPSLDELERRLRERGDTDPHEVLQRLAVAEAQIADAAANFDHLVVNDDIGAAVSEVTGILAT
ncbi:MAG: guanylate kinase [Acidimicrobiia bacterium]|nr:guanylate kinase [Acidimicrobiia bacterium]